MVNQFRRWFEYEKQSHRKTLASLSGLPGEARQQAADMLAHLVAARWLWLRRLGAAPGGPPEMFPHGVPLESLPGRFEEMERAWEAYLAKLDEAELARRFEYSSMEGPRYSNTVEEILTQVSGHSWYHRGQIAALVRASGGLPAVTDYVFWTRQPL